MQQPALDTYLFRLKRSAYKRNLLLGWLTFVGFLVCAAGALFASMLLWPTYSHAFTPYLKWQDALLGLLCFVAFIALVGGVMVLRYLCALRSGYREGMLTISGAAMIVRDLSHKNLGSIFWVVCSSLTCFLAALAGLVPLMLIGWTLSWSNPLLVLVGMSVVLLLSLAGLVATVVVLFVLGCALVSCVSFCRKMGSAQTYRLNSYTSLMIHGFALSILSPGEQESLFELDLLEPEDQQHLLVLLRKRWIDADRPWNPNLGEEIEAAMEEARQLAISA